jgi:hypothetical protein
MWRFYSVVFGTLLDKYRNQAPAMKSGFYANKKKGHGVRHAL